MALGDVIARLAVSLSLETAAFEKGSRKAQSEVQTLGQKMTKVAGVIGAAFVASIGTDTVRAWADATKGALEFAGSLGETAQQVGATTNELQEFRYVASQVGIEQIVMDKGLAKLSVTLGNLRAGIGNAGKTLQQFGFTQADVARISTMSGGDALTFLAGKYEALQSPTEKAALAAVFFGSRMGGQFIPLLNEGAAGLDKMRQAAHDLGIVISEAAIDNADKNADLLSTYEQIAEAQKTAALTIPENVKAYVAYEKTITDLQLAFYKAVAALNEFNEWSKRADQSIRDFGKNTGAQDFFHALFVGVQISDIADAFVNAQRSILQTAERLVSGIQHWIGGVLGSLWEGAKAKIDSVAAKFNWLYDVVIGHSYIPDMVDGIAAQMARLDAVMVAPVTAATTKAETAFRDMAGNLKSILDRLFPEMRRVLDFRADRATILGSNLSDADKQTALGALLREGRNAPDLGDGGPLVQGMGDTADAIERLTEKAKIGTVKIAKSFKDMADETLQSLGRLTQAIKGGGFLDIIGAVADLGLQLAGSGAFGSKIAARVNAVPGHAMGTASAARGLALVGERGPELVRFRGGERVYNNRDTRGMMGGNVYHINGNLLTPEFWEMIQSGNVAAARAGAEGGVALGQYKASRRWR